MHEIIIHGRGGQGAVTTGQLIAIAAFYDKKFSQTFPMFGVERTGAPVQAFARIDDKEINNRSEVYNPNNVIVLEPSLLEIIDVTKGLKTQGTVIINTNKKVALENFNVHCIDATKIALDVFEKPFVNTVMLGAFSKVTKLITLDSLKKAIDERFTKPRELQSNSRGFKNQRFLNKGKTIAELNKKAIEIAYNQTQ